MEKKLKKEDLENIIGSYGGMKNISEALKEDPWDYELRKELGRLKGDENFYSETGPDAVRYAADDKVEEIKKLLQENVSYTDLISTYDGDKLKALLEILPPLKDDKSELAKAHKEFYQTVEILENGLKLMKRDPEKYKRTIASLVEGADKYLARGRDESTRKVAYGQLLEARRKLYQVIDKIKPENKK